MLLYNIAQCHRVMKHNGGRAALLQIVPAQGAELAAATGSGAEDRRARGGGRVAEQKPSRCRPTSFIENGEKPRWDPKAVARAGGRARAGSRDRAGRRGANGAPVAQPIYKKWWLWTAVGGVVVVAVVVGVAVGASQNSAAGLQLPGGVVLDSAAHQVAVDRRQRRAAGQRHGQR